jgi:Na+-transporting methylmalonyl-CoA/oxaloacetate decarboxylase gamma subunit|tara:strand:+ start:362 stop:547 length:186 start_codon:yes stop_codon:yes gene_type:complete
MEPATSQLLLTGVGMIALGLLNLAVLAYGYGKLSGRFEDVVKRQDRFESLLIDHLTAHHDH